MASKAKLLRVTTSYHHKQHLRYSPHGNYLVFARTIGPRIQLMKVSVDGGVEGPLLPERPDDYIQQHPCWSPDGKLFAFTGNDGHRNLRIGIYRGEAAQTTLVNIKPWLMGGEDSYVTWSPDGKRVAFIANNCRLFIANSDGTGRKLLGPAEGISAQPSWSPRDSRIAFASSFEGNFEIYTIQPDGAGLTRLTRNDSADQRPVFSPDGQWLAFTALRQGRQAIYRMRTDGSDVRCLTPEGDGHDHAAWSPDGKELAWISTRDGGYDVYRMSL